MLPRPSWPRAVHSRSWQNWLRGSIGISPRTWFGDHAWRDAGWARVFQVPTPESRFSGVLPAGWQMAIIAPFGPGPARPLTAGSRLRSLVGVVQMIGAIGRRC